MKKLVHLDNETADWIKASAREVGISQAKFMELIIEDAQKRGVGLELSLGKGKSGKTSEAKP